MEVTVPRVPVCEVVCFDLERKELAKRGRMGQRDGLPHPISVARTEPSQLRMTRSHLSKKLAWGIEPICLPQAPFGIPRSLGLCALWP